MQSLYQLANEINRERLAQAHRRQRARRLLALRRQARRAQKPPPSTPPASPAGPQPRTETEPRPLQATGHATSPHTN